MTFDWGPAGSKAEDTFLGIVALDQARDNILPPSKNTKYLSTGTGLKMLNLPRFQGSSSKTTIILCFGLHKGVKIVYYIENLS